MSQKAMDGTSCPRDPRADVVASRSDEQGAKGSLGARRGTHIRPGDVIRLGRCSQPDSADWTFVDHPS